jgi:hypothetical protein
VDERDEDVGKVGVIGRDEGMGEDSRDEDVGEDGGMLSGSPAESSDTE